VPAALAFGWLRDLDPARSAPRSPRRDVAIPGSTHRITHRRRPRRVRTDHPRRPSGRARRPIQASTTEDGSLQTLHGAPSGSLSRRGKPVLPTGERGQCRRVAHRHEHRGLSASPGGLDQVPHRSSSAAAVRWSFSSSGYPSRQCSWSRIQHRLLAIRPQPAIEPSAPLAQADLAALVETASRPGRRSPPCSISGT
jgi:hypothetical protein